MAVTAKLYAGSQAALANKEIDLNSDSLYGMLVDSSYVFDQAAHNYLDDVVADEVAGTGYTANGQALAGVTVSLVGNTLTLDATDLDWPDSTISADGLVIYDRTPATDATRPLLVFIDFGETKVSDAGAFTVEFNASGIASWTVA